jgi:hypothetical protein
MTSSWLLPFVLVDADGCEAGPVIAYLRDLTPGDPSRQALRCPVTFFAVLKEGCRPPGPA